MMLIDRDADAAEIGEGVGVIGAEIFQMGDQGRDIA